MDATNDQNNTSEDVSIFYFTLDKDHLGAAEVKHHESHPKYGHAIPSEVHPTWFLAWNTASIFIWFLIKNNNNNKKNHIHTHTHTHTHTQERTPAKF